MSLKILGGVAKGHSLSVPKGDLIRPTSVRLRRRFFDAFQDWESMIFVDLCAGSGAMGLEAWSRGAAEIYLVESQKRVFELMSKNALELQSKLSEQLSGQHTIALSNRSCQKWLAEFAGQYSGWSLEKRQQTMLFFDPPYKEKELYQQVVFELLKETNWFEGKLLLESDRQKGFPLDYWSEQGLECIKSFTQGTSYIAIFPFEARTKKDS
jgi:16S rRNA (guanine966-N2)-methyltransferase